MKIRNWTKRVKGMNVAHYLICNPYSKLGKSRMGNDHEENEELFFNAFMVVTNKIFERLARIANIVLDSSMNTVFITGYRGCGKTTFSKIMQAVMDSRIVLPQFDECLREEQELNYYDDRLLEELPAKYDISKSKIYNTISDKVYFEKSFNR